MLGSLKALSFSAKPGDIQEVSSATVVIKSLNLISEGQSWVVGREGTSTLHTVSFPWGSFSALIHIPSGT